MKDGGNWIKMAKELVAALPRNTPYTIVEAAFSVACDLDNDSLRSQRAYAKIWGWSRGKVRNFFNGTVVPIEAHSKPTRRPLKVRIVGLNGQYKAHLKPKRSPLEAHYYKTDRKGFKSQAEINKPAPGKVVV